MTVKVTKPAISIREELAKGTQKYTQQQFWMDGFVTNGTFDTALTGWVTGGNDGASASVVGAAARLVGNSYVYQTISGLTAGKTYILTADITGTNTVGSLRIGTSVNVGDLYDSPTQNSVTTLTETFVPSDTTVVVTLKCEGTSGNTSLYMDFDNISVYEVDSNGDVIHTMPLGWKPLHVYEDGLIQREGDANDYTVVKTGDSYSVKPSVAPSASTQTCVIAELEL